METAKLFFVAKNIFCHDHKIDKKKVLVSSFAEFIYTDNDRSAIDFFVNRVKPEIDRFKNEYNKVDSFDLVCINVKDIDILANDNYVRNIKNITYDKYIKK